MTNNAYQAVWTEHPLTGCKCCTVRHPSGLTVCVGEQPGFHTAAMRLAVRFGSSDTHYRANGSEYSLLPGTAHFLEHQLFENKDVHAMAAFDALGASSNASTGSCCTTYKAETARNAREVLALLLKTVQEPQFTAKTVEKERGIIAHELRMRQDAPFYAVARRAKELRYPGHPLAEDPIGTLRSIGAITPEHLTQAHTHWYHPGNMLLSCAGNITLDEVMETVDCTVKTLPPAETVSLLPPVPLVPPQPSLYEPEKMAVMPIVQLMFTVGTEQIPPMTQLRDTLYTRLAYELIFGDISVFAEKMRSAHQILDSLSYSGSVYPQFRDVQIYAHSVSEPERYIAEVFAELDRVSRDGLDRELFRIAKRSAYANACCSQNTPEQFAKLMESAWLGNVPMFSAVQLLADCTLDTVQNTLPELFPKEQCFRLIMVPDDSGEEGEL